MQQGLLVAAAGLLAGCIAAGVAALLAARMIASVLYSIGVADPFSWFGAAALLLAVSALANLIPAWRASRVDPSEALRID
jgi:putative ABC transport system permease protein